MKRCDLFIDGCMIVEDGNEREGKIVQRILI
jgi:hypothetical protein